MMLLKLFIVAFAIMLAICGMLYFWQEKILFFPRMPAGYEDPSKNPEGLRHPTEYRIACQDVKIESTGGVVLHAWYMKQPNSKERPTLVFFQGNAGNIGFRLPNLVDLYRYLKVNIVAPSYRGYGHSTGIPSEDGLKDDVRSVLDYFTKNAESLQIDEKRFLVFGRSLGGALAIYLAHEYPSMIKAVMLENTFLSIKEMAKQILPPLRRMHWLLNILARIGFKSDELIPELPMPILFISGEDDTLVPPFHMQNLFTLAAKAKFKWLVKVAAATHNDTWQTCPQEYYAALQQFLVAWESSNSTASVPEADRTRQFRLNGDVKKSSETCLKARGPKFYEVMPRQVAHSQA